MVFNSRKLKAWGQGQVVLFKQSTFTLSFLKGTCFLSRPVAFKVCSTGPFDFAQGSGGYLNLESDPSTSLRDRESTNFKSSNLQIAPITKSSSPPTLLKTLPSFYSRAFPSDLGLIQGGGAKFRW